MLLAHTVLRKVSQYIKAVAPVNITFQEHALDAISL